MVCVSPVKISSGTGNIGNNTCNKIDGEENPVTCSIILGAKATDIFDVVGMLEFLSGEKNLSQGNNYYNFDDDDRINLQMSLR